MQSTCDLFKHTKKQIMNIQELQKKYELSATHSEILEVVIHIQNGKALDLGCGRGRNSLFLQSLGFDVTAVDKSDEGIEYLNDIIEKENLSNITANTYNIHDANIQETFDLIISTVVLMFLDADRITDVIQNMQKHTNPGGYNVIVAAMDTDDYPCVMPFSFTFKEGELKEYYKDWEIIKYNENTGELHKTDILGNRIKMRFATIIAKKK